MAVRQTSTRLHNFIADLPVLPATCAGPSVLPKNLPSPEKTQVVKFYFLVPNSLLVTSLFYCLCYFYWSYLFGTLFSMILSHELSVKRPHVVLCRDILERSRRTRGAQRINIMLLAIVVAFALCWLPLNVFNTLFDWHHQALPDCQHDAVFSACHLTAMASTCINPVVYGFLNSNFQRELRTTLQRCQCGNRAGESYESFPLSTVGSEGVTKATSLNRMGSVCIPSPRLEISSAVLAKTLPANMWFWGPFHSSLKNFQLGRLSDV